MKKVRYALEFALLSLLFVFFRALPPARASALGGWIGRSVGPRLAASRKALANLRAALPGLSPAREREIIAGMWDNLGRLIAEYPHLKTLARDATAIEGLEILQTLRDDSRAGLLFGGHLANWEIVGPALLFQVGLPIGLIYRAPNNPGAAGLLDRARSLNGTLKTFPKSPTGTRQFFRHLREGGHAGILIDQKYNEGVEALFFGRPAMTSPAFVHLCQKFSAPLVPFQIIRTGGARFRLIVHPPLPVADENGDPLPVEHVIAQAHALLEGWIRQYPDQWLWLHRRWKSS
jgi:KDO2-lipid IV(A) lauroyltransferase